MMKLIFLSAFFAAFSAGAFATEGDSDSKAVTLKLHEKSSLVLHSNSYDTDTRSTPIDTCYGRTRDVCSAQTVTDCWDTTEDICTDPWHCTKVTKHTCGPVTKQVCHKEEYTGHGEAECGSSDDTYRTTKLYDSDADITVELIASPEQMQSLELSVSLSESEVRLYPKDDPKGLLFFVKELATSSTKKDGKVVSIRKDLQVKIVEVAALKFDLKSQAVDKNGFAVQLTSALGLTSSASDDFQVSLGIQDNKGRTEFEKDLANGQYAVADGLFRVNFKDLPFKKGLFKSYAAKLKVTIPEARLLNVIAGRDFTRFGSWESHLPELSREVTFGL